MAAPDPFTEIYGLARSGAYDAALERLLDATGARLVPPFDDDLNHGWYVVGNLYYKKCDFEAAARAFDKSVADRPDDHEALLALANCYFEMEMPAIAETYLRVALKYSESPSIIYNLGNALFDQKKYDDAIVMYEKLSSNCGQIYELAQKNLRKAKRLRNIREPGER